MKKILKISVFTILSAALITVFFMSCTGVGIFAVVAVSDKIDEGTLPEGLSAQPVMHITGSGDADNYLFFTSGPALWAKNRTTDSRWYYVPLIDSAGNTWDGIQSACVYNDGTTDRIFLALYKADSDNYTVRLFWFESFNASARKITLNEVSGQPSWGSSSSGYQTLRLFSPAGSSDVFVNVLQHGNEYASTDVTDKGFEGSDLYRLNTPAGTPSWSSTAVDTSTYLDDRYVTGIASSNGTDYLISSTRSFLDPDGGLLFSWDGSSSTSIDYGSNVSVIGLKYLDISGWTTTGNNGAFIMTATAKDNDGSLPMFASFDGSDGSWERVSGTSTDFLTTNFVNVSDYTAGQSDGKHLALAGTTSYIEKDGGTYDASGYNEINITDDDISNWHVYTNWDDYSFALPTNYSVSLLKESTIVGMSIQQVKGTDYLFASTKLNGLWRIALNEDQPSWTRE